MVVLTASRQNTVWTTFVAKLGSFGFSRFLQKPSQTQNNEDPVGIYEIAASQRTNLIATVWEFSKLVPVEMKIRWVAAVAAQRHFTFEDDPKAALAYLLAYPIVYSNKVCSAGGMSMRHHCPAKGEIGPIGLLVGTQVFRVYLRVSRNSY